MWRSGLLGALVLVAVAANATAQVREVTLEDAVRLSLGHAPELHMARADVDKAADRKAGAIGMMAPRLTLDASIQYWDKATRVQFVDPASLPTKDDLGDLGAIIPDSFFQSFAELAKPMEVQKQVTGSVNVQAVQPLTPLYALANLYRMQGAALEAARFDQAAKQATVVFQTTEVFFKLMSALRMVEVTQFGIEQVQAHLKTAQSFHNAGLVGRDDVLRAETALARVLEQHSRVLSGVALARSALNVKMGRPIDDATVPVGDYPDPPAELTMTEEQLVERALSERPERRAIDQQVRMAAAGKQAAVGALIPTIAAVFRYTHFEGSKFQREDSAFVGAVLQWNFWDWGNTWFQMKAVGRDHEKARFAIDLARDGIMLDVRKSWLDLKQARSSMDADRSQITSAEENLRVVTRKYEAATATSVEVLDAQSTLTRARADYQVALLDYYISYANLQRATAGSL